MPPTFWPDFLFFMTSYLSRGPTRVRTRGAKAPRGLISGRDRQYGREASNSNGRESLPGLTTDSQLSMSVHCRSPLILNMSALGWAWSRHETT